MIKKLSKLTMVMILMGVFVVGAIRNSLLEDFANHPENNANGVDLIGKLLSFSERHAVSGNCWQYYVAYFIANNVNAFSLSCERKPNFQGSLAEFAYEECRHLMDIFNYPLSSLPTVNPRRWHCFRGDSQSLPKESCVCRKV